MAGKAPGEDASQGDAGVLELKELTQCSTVNSLDANELFTEKQRVVNYVTGFYVH